MKQVQQIMFMKNISLAGAALMLCTLLMAYTKTATKKAPPSAKEILKIYNWNYANLQAKVLSMQKHKEMQ